MVPKLNIPSSWVSSSVYATALHSHLIQSQGPVYKCSQHLSLIKLKMSLLCNSSFLCPPANTGSAPELPRDLREHLAEFLLSSLELI